MKSPAVSAGIRPGIARPRRLKGFDLHRAGACCEMWSGWIDAANSSPLMRRSRVAPVENRRARAVSHDIVTRSVFRNRRFPRAVRVSRRKSTMFWRCENRPFPVAASISRSRRARAMYRECLADIFVLWSEIPPAGRRCRPAGVSSPRRRFLRTLHPAFLFVGVERYRRCCNTTRCAAGFAVPPADAEWLSGSVSVIPNKNGSRLCGPRRQ